MLSRDQVLHVARLARLELTAEEVERFGGELSKVLDHIELIAELGDLADVPPTSHVIDVENALRADEPRPSMPVERALEIAPDAALGGFRVPSPGALMMLELTAAQAAERIKERRPRRRRVLRVLPPARRRGRLQLVHLGRGRDAGAGHGHAVRRRPDRDQGPLLHRGHPEPGRLEDPRGLPPAVHGDVACATSTPPAARCWARPTRTSSRWARPPRTPPTARR